MDSANLATVIAPNVLHSNTDTNAAAVATDEQAEERLDVINVVRTMIDHYEELFSVPADVMDDVYTVMMDANPEQLDYIFDRKDSFDVNNSRREWVSAYIWIWISWILIRFCSLEIQRQVPKNLPDLKYMRIFSHNNTVLNVSNLVT